MKPEKKKKNNVEIAKLNNHYKEWTLVRKNILNTRNMKAYFAQYLLEFSAPKGDTF